MFQNINYVTSNCLSLKYFRFTPLCCKDIRIRIFLLCGKDSISLSLLFFLVILIYLMYNIKHSIRAVYHRPIFKKTNDFLNERFYWTIVKWENERSRWEMNDQFENDWNQFFLTIEKNERWMMNERNEKRRTYKSIKFPSSTLILLILYFIILYYVFC